jgi:hypothetical protein
MTFKKKQHENLQDRRIRQLAERIGNLELLDKIISDAQPEYRKAVFERIRPFLSAELQREAAEKGLACLADLPEEKTETEVRA